MAWICLLYLQTVDGGGGVLPDEQASDKVGVTDKTVAEVLAGKHPPKKNLVFHWNCMMQLLFLSPWIIQRNWSSRWFEKIRGALVPVERNRKPYRMVATKIWGPQQKIVLMLNLL